MRTTVTIDDDLYAEALAIAGPGLVRKDFFREAVEAFIHMRASSVLASLGGSAPEMEDVPRRRAPDSHGSHE